MIKIFTLVGVLSCLFLGTAGAADVNFFPPSPEAKPVDDFDQTGFIINGQRTFLASGSIHYPRVPQALWRDRLLRLKRAGFNTVQTYVFWNYHEQKEDTFDFTGEKDLGLFLKSAQDVGLYATVRVGPYACAEWNFGGYPLWLKFKPGIHVRDGSPDYQHYQGEWLSKVLPIVADHQINHGGNVIFVQLENEGAFWGAWTHDHPNNDPYWQTLYKSAIDNGIQVPFFMSGMHHGFAPMPEDTNSANRVNPWYATEVWSGWYDIYGEQEHRNVFFQISDFMTKALARGANGYNFYMAHGGTNFDYWNNNEDAATYDYGAPIGQTGDLRSLYYRMKRYNYFATSFADILENATGDISDYKSFVTNGYLIGVRKSPVGTVVFVQGSASLSVPLSIQGVGEGAGGSMQLPNLDVAGIVLDATLVPAPAKIRIIEAVTQILGVAHHGKTTTLIVHGKPGDTGVLTLDLGGEKKQLQISYPEGVPTETPEKVGDQTLRILSLSSALEPYTWIVGPEGEQCVVVGPEYLGDFTEAEGKPSMTIERYYNHQAPSQVLVYGDANVSASHLAVSSDSTMDNASAPALSAWLTASAPSEIQPTFNDAGWKQSDDPVQMGADGDVTCYAWYRAAIQAPSAGNAVIHFAGAADHLLVYVNGQQVKATPSQSNPKYVDNPLMKNGELTWDAQADLHSGSNCLAVFVSHQGRDKAFAYSGPVADYYPKGIFKPVTVQLNGQTIAVQGWKLHGGIPYVDKLAFLSPDATHNPSGPAFFQTTFTAKPPGKTGANPILRFDTAGLSRGSLFLNGHNLGRYPDPVQMKGKPLPLYLPECWLNPDGSNSLVVFDEEGTMPAQTKLEVETTTSREIIAVSAPVDPTATFTAPAYNGYKTRDGASLDTETDRPVSSSSCVADNPAYFVNDGQENTAWYPASAPNPDHPQWIQIDLGSPLAFKSFEIGWTCPVCHVSYHLEGSMDGNGWTKLVDEPATGGSKSDTWKTVPVPDGTSARYIRLTITDLKNESSVGVTTLRTH